MESVKALTKIPAFGEDRGPAEARLESLEAQLFEEAMIVLNREATFVIVIGAQFRYRPAPVATQPVFGAGEGCCHYAVSSCGFLAPGVTGRPERERLLRLPSYAL